jgi:hypothetical protein
MSVSVGGGPLPAGRQAPPWPGQRQAAKPEPRAGASPSRRLSHGGSGTSLPPPQERPAISFALGPGRHILSQNVTVNGPGWQTRACHEMNVIWRQLSLSSDGIGGGAGGLSRSCPYGKAPTAGKAGFNASDGASRPSRCQGPRRFLPSQSGRHLRGVVSSQSGISRAKLATRAEHGIEGLEEALTCIALLPCSVSWPAWPAWP